MASGKIVCAFLVLSMFHQAVCQPEEENVGKCIIQMYFNGNSNWQQVTKTTKLSTDTKTLNRTVCCEGFTYNYLPVCRRKCPADSCIVGFCPPADNNDHCKCYDSRNIHYDNFECIPICKPANCDEDQICPNDCICHSGYTKDPRINLCVPTECYDRCTKGQCDQSGACFDCKDVTDHTDIPGICLIKNCVQNSFNGHCMNGTCFCDEGFENVNSLTCTNVSCPSSDVKDTLFCKEQCDASCINGHCSGDGICSCDYGYHFDPSNNCVPLCISECTNGNCTGPNECSCDEGFVEVNGSCVDDCSVLGNCNLAWVGAGAGVGTLLVIASVLGGVVIWIAKGRRKRSMSLDGESNELD